MIVEFVVWEVKNTVQNNITQNSVNVHLITLIVE